MKSTYKIIGAVIIVVLIIVVIIIASKKSDAPSISNQSASTSDFDTVGAGLPDNILMMVAADKVSYTQDENITITVAVKNNTKQTKTFSFKNGCVGDYSVAGFKLSEHMLCRPEATSFDLSAGASKEIKLVHYPSLFKIPVGKQTITAGIIGYGDSSININITK